MAQNYDYIIVGSDLGSLALACALSKNTPHVALVDSEDAPGADWKAVQFPTGTISNGFHFTPDSAPARKAISFLKSLGGASILGPARTLPPLTFESGQLKEFLGFGDLTPEFYDEIKFFTEPDRRELLVPNQQWAQLLIENFKGEFLPRSYVTKIEVENDRVTSVMINGAKSLRTNNLIYCQPIKFLPRLLPESALSQKLRTKMAKTRYWSALYLDLCHSQPVTESNAVHILNGTTADEFGPCGGIFQPPVSVGDKSLQTSQWVTFVEDGAAEDESEVVGLALKKMKRQIKRAYPNSLDALVSERIRWAPLVSEKGEFKLNANQSIGDLENLWVATGAVNPQKFWIGSLLQAELVLAAMGFSNQTETPGENAFETTDESAADSNLENTDVL